MTESGPGPMVCPFCGPRDDSEFRHGGDPAILRPAAADGAAAWAEYLYVRANPQGLAREYWVHARGCGQWLVVERDTVSHAVRQVDGPAP